MAYGKYDFRPSTDEEYARKAAEEIAEKEKKVATLKKESAWGGVDTAIELARLERELAQKDDKNGDSPYFSAAERGDVAAMRKMLDDGEIEPEEYNEALCEAASTGRLEAVQFILDEGLYQRLGSDSVGEHTVVRACADAILHGNEEIARLLLKQKDVKLQDVIDDMNGTIGDMLEDDVSDILGNFRPGYEVAKKMGVAKKTFGQYPGVIKVWEQNLPQHMENQVFGQSDWSGMRLIPPDLLQSESSYGFKPKAYAALLPKMQEIAHKEGGNDDHACIYSYKLATLFGAEQAALQYLKRWAPSIPPKNLKQPTMAELLEALEEDANEWAVTKQPVHDACLFEIPKKGLWNIAGWRDLTMKFGPEMAKMLHAAPQIEQALGRLPKSLREARETAGQFLYEKGGESPELATICHELGLPEDEFNDCLRVVKSHSKTRDNMPKIFVDGAEFGQPGYYLTKLDVADPRGLLLGEYTNCCQSLGNFGDEEARHGFSNEDGAFYVVMKRPPKGREGDQPKIVAQMYGWIKEKAFVLDSWERLSDGYDHLCEPFVKRACDQAVEQGFDKGNLGKGGNTPILDGYKTDPNPPDKPEGFEGKLNDSRKQYTISKKTR